MVDVSGKCSEMVVSSGLTVYDFEIKLNFILNFVSDKFKATSPELEILIEQFRDEALQLLSLLDSSMPIVKKIKVSKS